MKRTIKVNFNAPVSRCFTPLCTSRAGQRASVIPDKLLFFCARMEVLYKIIKQISFKITFCSNLLQMEVADQDNGLLKKVTE